MHSGLTLWLIGLTWREALIPRLRSGWLALEVCPPNLCATAQYLRRQKPPIPALLLHAGCSTMASEISPQGPPFVNNLVAISSPTLLDPLTSMENDGT